MCVYSIHIVFLFLVKLFNQNDKILDRRKNDHWKGEEKTAPKRVRGIRVRVEMNEQKLTDERELCIDIYIYR